MGAVVKYNNLTGGLNTVQGINTINQSAKRTESPEMYNVEYYKLGGLCTMDGNKQFGNALSSSVTLGYEYIYGNYKYMVVCTLDGKVWIYNKISNNFDMIYQFKTPTNRHSICSFNNGIVISNGIDDLVYYQYNRNELLAGNVTLENGSKKIIGTDTKFTEELSVGDYISFNNISGKFKIDEISDDTNLQLDRNIEVETPKIYYAFTKEDTTYYIDELTNLQQLNVYTISLENKITKVSSEGIFNNNILTVPIRQKNIVNGIRYDNWTQPNITSDTTFGTIHSDDISNPYLLFTKEGSGEISKGIINIDWTFDQEMEVSNFSFDITNLNPSGIIKILDGNNNLLASRNISNNNGKLQHINLDFNPIKTSKINIQFSFTPSIGNKYSSYIFNILMTAKQSVEYEYEEIITENKELTRDTQKDKNIDILLSNISYYLTDISELNAVYVNTDDPNINRPIRGLAINSYRGRIFVGSDDGVLYYSEVGLIHGWDLKFGAGAIPTFYDDNSDFTALGIFDKYLVICKRERSYLLDGTSSQDIDWTINPYSDYTCDSQQSWLVANNSFLVYSRKAGGIYPLLQRTIYSPNYQGTEISIKIRDSFTNISTSKYDYIFPVYNSYKKYLMFYLPTVMGTGSNYCYIFDLQTKTWLLRILPQNVTVAFRFDNNIYIGTQDGLILKEFVGSTFNGETIKWSWKSPWFSFGDGSNYLSTREFRINISEEGANNFQVKVRRDGIDKASNRKVSVNDNNFRSLVWESKLGEDSVTDTVWGEDSWTINKHTIKRFPLANQYFQTLQIELYGENLNENMNIYGFEFHGIQLEEVPW